MAEDAEHSGTLTELSASAEAELLSRAQLCPGLAEAQPCPGREAGPPCPEEEGALRWRAVAVGSSRRRTEAPIGAPAQEEAVARSTHRSATVGPSAMVLEEEVLRPRGAEGLERHPEAEGRFLRPGEGGGALPGCPGAGGRPCCDRSTAPP